MNILELEIWNVRGIPHLILKPDGENVVVWGRNGSGKSAVVDAIDFLLTGHISRLIGEGTGDITLARHGPHILHNADEAVVRAKISLPFIERTVEIRRCIENPTEIEIECEKEDRELIEFALERARNGNHVLTRREILRYIHTEPRIRADRIEAILNISEIGEIRSALVNVRNKSREEFNTSKTIINSAEGAVNSTVGQTTFVEEAVMDFVNSNRAILGGKSITTISSEEIQKGLRKPVDSIGVDGVNVAMADKDIGTLRSALLEQNRSEIAEKDKVLREALAEIRKDPEVARTVSRIRLFEMGKELIDESGDCPLCDVSWERGKLAEYLDRKIERGHDFAAKNKIVDRSSSDISNRMNITVASIRKLVDATEKVGAEKETYIMKSWLKDLEELLSELSNPLEKYPDSRFDMNSVKNMAATESIEGNLDSISKILHEKVPEATPELNAWTALTRLGENLKAVENAKLVLEKSILYKKRAESLHENFIISRDRILGQLYNGIRNRFVELYEELHSSDESGFKAKLEPAGAGLDFEVDFYGLGSHPPHALHSEGHQDSMGICLYLALAERLNAGIINLIILDDVVMSVDTEHRRQVCGVLDKSFPTRQFIITTHDRTWANQLKTGGVVKSKNLVEFHNWSISGGPQVNYDVIMWDEIENDLENDDVPSAAHKLRRGLECFFNEVCDSLEAEVKYNMNHRWELGDFLQAAIRKYRSLLKQAKKSANSWNNQYIVEKLNEMEELSGRVISSTNSEQWAVNSSVHYNRWVDLVREDFIPVVEAFKDMCSLFVCGKCGGFLKVTSVDNEPANVCCRCGEESWNLVVKELRND